MDELLSQRVDRSVQLEHYLGQYLQSQTLGSMVEVIEPDSEIEESEPDSDSDPSEDGDRDSPTLPNLERVQAFIATRNALSNLRDRLRSFVLLQASSKDGPPPVEQLNPPKKASESIGDQTFIKEAETSIYGQMVSDHISTDPLTESK